MTRRIAIVGSGPAGCYAAERLAREADCEIDVLERLPTPFGLVRAGVAPDHQSTKSIARVLERALARPSVRFFGHVDVGRDVRLDALRELYDAVVLATGATADRRLDLPGSGLPGIVGSGEFVFWLNAHPDWATRAVDLSQVRSAVVIGNGNVAIDVARLLAKAPAELAVSDISAEAEAGLAAAPLREIHIVGRRGPADARFTPKELGELAELARARPVVSPDDLPPADAAPGNETLPILKQFAAAPPRETPVAIRFHFHARPLRFEGADRVERAVFSRQEGVGAGWRDAGSELALSADLVVTCIGYDALPCCTAAPERGVFLNEGGRSAPGLYVVGWAKRGPSGTIATNRAEAHEVMGRLLAETNPGGRSGREGLLRLLAEAGRRAVDLALWQRIDAAERARAAPGRPRAKFSRVAEMLSV
jgi:ferredoxin--NADP+ reductase